MINKKRLEWQKFVICIVSMAFWPNVEIDKEETETETKYTDWDDILFVQISRRPKW